MKRKMIAIVSCLLSILSVQAVAMGNDSLQAACPVVKLQVERLPELNIPRAGHQLFYANGELTVAGGHTDGFVPTPTAEYFSDGEWHTMQMTYTHDFGLSTVLQSGRVLLAGGCEQATGIGQTFTAEIYDPQTHTFRGFGNMQRKRVWASSLELDSGQVVIAGNWYHHDGIEVFSEAQSHAGDNNSKQSFTYIKDVAVDRASPYIFRMADGDVLILGALSPRGDTLHCSFADRLKGDTVHIPLFETWHPLLLVNHRFENSLISDASQDVFTYLMPVQDNSGQVAIAQVCGTDITLLPISSPIPMQGMGEQIEYGSDVIVDRQAKRAYLAGYGSTVHVAPEKVRLYVIAIDYAQASEGGAPMTLYYTDPMAFVPDYTPLLTPEGNLLIAGGMRDGSNFTPSASVCLLRLGREPEKASGGMAWWIWALLAVVAIGAVAVLIGLRRRREDMSADDDSQDQQAVSQPANYAELMERINQLMENEKIYLDSDLKLTDLAAKLNMNRSYVSDCINSQTGCSLTQYINGYRIEHAKKMLRSNPDIKMTQLYLAVGFSTEQTFYRAFKAVTGMTPKEWIARQQTSDGEA